MPVHWETCGSLVDGYSAPQLCFVSGAYGTYVPLFAAALLSSWQESTRGSKAMCAVSIVMFVVVTMQVGLTIYLGSISCSTLASELYHDISQATTLLYNQVPSTILGASTTIAGLLSDGVLAWRCYILYSRQRWMLWLMGAAIAAVGACGVVMAVYYGERNTENDVSWSPLYLAINGSLTVLVTARIFVLHRRTSFGTCRSILVTAGRTVVESALISWVGVFMMLLTDYHPDMLGTRTVVTYDGYGGHYEESGLGIFRLEVQPALAAALPAIFGISQTLIVTRVALSRLAKSPDFTATVNALTSDFVSDGSRPAV